MEEFQEIVEMLQKFRCEAIESGERRIESEKEKIIALIRETIVSISKNTYMGDAASILFEFYGKQIANGSVKCWNQYEGLQMNVMLVRNRENGDQIDVFERNLDFAISYQTFARLEDESDNSSVICKVTFEENCLEEVSEAAYTLMFSIEIVF